MSTSTLISLGAAMAALGLSGCQPAPATDADDMIAYARNAAVGAKVRVLDAEAQPYVRDVFQAFYAWQQSLAPISDLADLDSLWPNVEDAWRDPKTVSKRLNTIKNWRLHNDHVRRREELHRAIQGVPVAYEEDAARIRTELERLLEDGTAEYLARVATEYEGLLVGLPHERSQSSDRADEKGESEHVEIPATVLRAWERLRETLRQARNKEVDQMEWALHDGKRLRDEAIAEKRTIRRAASSAPRAFQRMRKLDIDLQYYDRVIHLAEARKRELTRAPGAAD